MTPDVSVVLPSFNHARFIEACVRSILTQQGVDLEVIVCDDASTDESLVVLAGIRDPRLKVLAHPRNLGAAAAVAPGLALARGRHVARMGSDDICLPGRLAKQCAWLDGHPGVACVFCMPEFIDDDGRVMSPPPEPFAGLFTSENRSRGEWLRTFLTKGNCLLAPGAMVRREVMERVPPTAGVFHHLPDLETWVRICLVADIHVLPEKLVGFRIHENAGNLSAPHPKRTAAAEMEKLAIWRYLTHPEALHLLGLRAGPLGRLDLARLALDNHGPAHRVFANLVLLETDLTRCPPEEAREFLIESADILANTDPMRLVETKRLRQRVAELEDKIRRLGEVKTGPPKKWPARWFGKSSEASRQEDGGSHR